MAFIDLRRAIEGEIFDYPTLIYHLREYKKPRDRVTRLLREESIIRIKKGLYIFGPDYQKKPVSLELLANLIYSPSYISLEYAISKYGLIPERAFAITSICLSRSKSFKTPVGHFIYKKRPLSAYPIGIKHIEIPHEGGYLMAEPEKALVDLIYAESQIKNISEMKEYLFENMRMELSELKKMKKPLLEKILDEYHLSQILVKAIYD